MYVNEPSAHNNIIDDSHSTADDTDEGSLFIVKTTSASHTHTHGWFRKRYPHNLKSNCCLLLNIEQAGGVGNKS